MNIIPRNSSYFALVVACSVIADFDYLFPREHRQLPTHTFAFWGTILVAIVIIRPDLWILAPPILLHLLMDLIDWGLMILYPFSRKLYGLKILRLPTPKTFVDRSKTTKVGWETKALYVKEYVGSRSMATLEILLMIASIVLLGDIGF